MDTPLKNRPLHGPIPRPAAGRMTAILGSLTIPGRPDRVSGARAFITRTLAASSRGRRVDSDAATLLASELVTNAILHTVSGRPTARSRSSSSTCRTACSSRWSTTGRPARPSSRATLFAADGHGLYLVQQLTAQWGYLRDPAGHHGLVPPGRGDRAGPPRALGGRSADRRSLGHRGEHARADGREVVVAGHVGRHRVDRGRGTAAARPRPATAASVAAATVDLPVELDHADRAEDPHVGDARPARHGGQAGASPPRSAAPRPASRG